MKRRTPLLVEACPQVPAIRLDNRSANGQPHTEALRLSGEKCVKHFLDQVWVKAYAGIRYRNLDLTLVIFLRLYRELMVGARVLHSIDSIEHQVHQNLPELHNVA